MRIEIDEDEVRGLIDQRARSHPDTIFLLAAENNLRICFGELQHHCLAIEKYLDRRNIERGQTVALMIDNGCWTAILMLGIMYSGRVVLPLNVVAGADQIKYVIHHSDLKIIFCTPHYHKLFADIFIKIAPTINIIQCHK